MWRMGSLLLLIVFLNAAGYSQEIVDTSAIKGLKEVMIRSWQKKDIGRLPEANNSFLFSGKKNEVISVSGLNTNISLKTSRQLFSKVPGVFVYDMDGSGNQINISTRGLDPHRSWEFNIRQNGVLTNSDMYGYPASHYSAPMESIDKIEIIRGTGSLQYGAQFGGMVNYETKKPNSEKPFSFETINTVGSYNLLSTYNSISGTKNKFSYLAYFYVRNSGGYRDNGNSKANAQYVQLNYRFSNSLKLTAELGRSKYIYQSPGPLTDSMFNADPTMSTRSRNYFSPDIYVPSITLHWKLNSKTSINLLTSGVFGNRSSVQFDNFANVPDAMDPATGEYKNRQVDIDQFNSKTAEIRLLHTYKIVDMESTLATGFIYMNNDLHRQQLGKGTTGTDYDLSLVEPGFGRDLHFTTQNIAAFVENAFHVTPKLTISPGIRFENGGSDMKGEIKYYTQIPLPTTIKHNFLLAGLSSQYNINSENSVYGGISQAYRPVIFKDIIPASTYEQIDKNLKDAFGYNLEIGLRGKIFRHLQYDISYFHIQYKNRMGTLVLEDDNGSPFTYKTNVGNSRTNGMELFLQYKFPVAGNLFAGIFTSTSLMDAAYTEGQIANGNSNKSITGNKVEAVPAWITRNGLDVLYKRFSCTILYNYTAETFSDALNTVAPTPTGAKGLTPGYSIWDFNATYQALKYVTVKAGVNNILNNQYFTKRPAFYPGPGIWPSDGRNVYLTIGIRL